MDGTNTKSRTVKNFLKACSEDGFFYLGLSGAEDEIKYILGLVQSLITILEMLDIEDPVNRGRLPRLEGLMQ